MEQWLIDILDKVGSNLIISDAFTKANSVINNPKYKKILCSISGGADSDVLLDLIYKVDKDKKVEYWWFDTGVEYKATKNQLEYLEQRYNIYIYKQKPIKPIPVVCKEYGQPFLSKYVSTHIEQLQRAGFLFEDKPFEELVQLYPGIKESISWWCNQNKPRMLKKSGKDFDGTSMFDINRYKYLKDFLIQNPPRFKVSASCCDWSKKKVSLNVIKKNEFELSITGVRKAEGGIRSTAYKNCYTIRDNAVDLYRPLFWFSNSDREAYETIFDIKHSECYTKYGFKRTGCVGCPFANKHLYYELSQTKLYEPLLYKACNNIFKESYAYIKAYRIFVQDMENKEKGKIRLF